MIKKICLPAGAGENKNKQIPVRVRIIKAPLVDTRELKQILLARAKALTL